MNSPQIPGSHHGLMEKVPGDRHALAADPSDAVDAEGRAGDLIIFSVYTAHHSYANRSTKGRKVLLYTYNPAVIGDTYDNYKGAHGMRCLAWHRENDIAAKNMVGLAKRGCNQHIQHSDVTVAGYSDDDPRLTPFRSKI